MPGPWGRRCFNTRCCLLFSWEQGAGGSSPLILPKQMWLFPAGCSGCGKMVCSWGLERVHSGRGQGGQAALCLKSPVTGLPGKHTFHCRFFRKHRLHPFETGADPLALGMHSLKCKRSDRAAAPGAWEGEQALGCLLPGLLVGRGVWSEQPNSKTCPQ